MVEEFLIESKACFPEYVGNELSTENFRVDVFGVSKKGGDEKIVYFLEGKRKLESRRHFSKVVGETIPLLDFADYVYIFGKVGNKNLSKYYIEFCKSLGIGILTIKGGVKEILSPKRNKIENLIKKEMLFRIFLKDVKKPISDLIFQSCYEYIKSSKRDCVRFIDAYESLFSNKEYKKVLNGILKKRKLSEMGMRREFQRQYRHSELVKIQRRDNIYEDIICITKKGMEKGKEPILLD